MKKLIFLFTLCSASLQAAPQMISQSTIRWYYDAKFSQEEQEKINIKMIHHHNNAVEIMHDLGWSLIDEDKTPDVLSILIKAAVGGLVPGTPLSRICLVIATVIQEYVPYGLDLWNQYSEDLENARYHFEMCEFYREILIYHGWQVQEFEDLSKCFPIVTDWENDPYEAYHIIRWK